MLRPFTPRDAADVQRLAGEFAVADTTLNVPHPYRDGVAESWIGTHRAAWEGGTAAVFAIEQPSVGLVGAVGLELSAQHRRGELGYWIGRPYWGRGFATEAARAVIAFAFETLELHRVQAMHFTRNPASGRVLEKAGMTVEGVHRHYLRRNDRFEDVARFAILADDWRRQPR